MGVLWDMTQSKSTAAEPKLGADTAIKTGGGQFDTWLDLIVSKYFTIDI